MDPEKVLRLCQDIRETFDRLDDLRSLTEGKLLDPDSLVEQRLTLAGQAKLAAEEIAQTRAKGLTLGADQPITPEQVQQLVLGPLAKGEVKFVQFDGGANPIFEARDAATGKTLFIFKQIKEAEEVAAEVLSGEVVRMLGIKTPGSRALRSPHTITYTNRKKVVPAEQTVE